MINLREMAEQEPQKLDELAAFHWFTQALAIEYDSLAVGESPDFIMQVDGRAVGVEITNAQRALPGSPFPAYQIEAAQRHFANGLLERVAPKLPLEIGLIFNDDVPVDKAGAELALDVIVPLIDQVSTRMHTHSVELLVRYDADVSGSTHKKHVCPEIPPFLQHIQLFNDGHRYTCVTGSRGGIMHDYTDSDLEPVLHRKHKALRDYRRCDEQWLVIVAGQVPPIVLPEEPPKLLIPSMASTFSGINVQDPVSSDFDRVYFFRSPADVTRLTA